MSDARQELSGCRVHEGSSRCHVRDRVVDGDRPRDAVGCQTNDKRCRDTVCMTRTVCGDMLGQRAPEMLDARQELSGCCVCDRVVKGNRPRDAVVCWTNDKRCQDAVCTRQELSVATCFVRGLPSAWQELSGGVSCERTMTIDGVMLCQKDVEMPDTQQKLSVATINLYSPLCRRGTLLS
jgi:hypothetical protein